MVGVGGQIGKRENGGRTGDGDDAVEGAEVGRKGAVVLRWVEDELGQPLGCMWWRSGERGGES